MIIKNLLLTSESYTHRNWVYRNVNVGFSRLYYIIEGEAYYEENGKTVRFLKNHLYLTPVRHSFTIYENEENKLLHTYAHITTLPEVTRFTEIEVIEGTPLADAVALWRKHVASGDPVLIADTIQFLLSRIAEHCTDNDTASRIKNHLDSSDVFDMADMCRTLGYSREHITRAFAAKYRMTPKQYYNAKRMNIALALLHEGEKIKAVADRLNFASPYSFSKAFKNHFGASPREYVTQVARQPQANVPQTVPER